MEDLLGVVLVALEALEAGAGEDTLVDQDGRFLMTMIPGDSVLLRSTR